MNWHTLSTAFAGALGGTATALVAVGLLSKTLLNNWFKQIYKAWEIELEQKYKEDFKRFEDTLDAIASRDETRFNYHFTNKAEAVKEIFKQSSELLATGSSMLYTKTKPPEIRNAEDCELITQQEKLYKDKLANLSIFAHSVIYLLDPKTNDLLRNYFGASAVIAMMGAYVNPHEREQWHGNAMRTLKQVEIHFRQFVEGDEKERSVPG